MKDKKAVLITGCSSGFGYHSALKFARNDWQTFAGIRNLESAGVKELLEIKKKENLSLEILPLDVISQPSVEEAVQMAVSKAGRIDVLVNNAGFGYFGPVEEFSIDEIRSQYETNVFGALRMIKAVVPLMRQRKAGTIINLSSIASLVNFPLFGVYASSKRALEALSEALRFELHRFGVRVVFVEPGSFKTEFGKSRKNPGSWTNSDSFYRELLVRSQFGSEKPYKKFLPKFLKDAGNPQEVADLIYKIAQESNPRMRYLIGKDAYVFNLLRKFIPQSLWEWLLHKVYRW